MMVPRSQAAVLTINWQRGSCAYHNHPGCWQPLVLDHHLKSTGVNEGSENLHQAFVGVADYGTLSEIVVQGDDQQVDQT